MSSLSAGSTLAGRAAGAALEPTGTARSTLSVLNTELQSLLPLGTLPQPQHLLSGLVVCESLRKGIWQGH